MKILFIHQNFPGQFKNLAIALAQKGHSVSALVPDTHSAPRLEYIKYYKYVINRVSTKDIHPLAVSFETKLIRAHACAIAADKLRKSGYTPDLIIGHPGWGETTFIKSVWSNSRLRLYAEYYYRANGADINFDPEFSRYDFESSLKPQIDNLHTEISFKEAEAGICPTNWQAQSFPEWIQKKLSILHEGVDTAIAKPNSSKKVKIGNNLILSKSDEIVTFVNRNLEPYRGFHSFIRALPKLLLKKEKVYILIIGNTGVGYGPPPIDYKNWREKYENEILAPLPAQLKNRVIFIPYTPYEQLISILQVSTIHVYLTYPFVLSWSLLDALSCGCSVIASDTGPVKEVITNNHNGLLVDFFNIDQIYDSISALLDNDLLRLKISQNAREYILGTYDLRNICLPNQLNWLEN